MAGRPLSSFVNSHGGAGGFHKQTHDAERHYAVAEALMRGFNASLLSGSSNIQVKGHKAMFRWLPKGHGYLRTSTSFMRPRNPDSKHAAIRPDQVAKWRVGWKRLA